MIFDEGIFDESYLEGLPGNGSYTLDIILEAAALPVVHQADLVIDQTKSLSFYVGMSGYRMLRSLAVDTILTHERDNPKFSETIINAIVWSYGQEVEALVDAISTMGLRLALPDATTEDMDQHWAKILALKRRYDESDSSFRSRLSTRLSIMKSSGTKPECEAVINHILGYKDAADIKTFGPGEIEVFWKNPIAMKLAESKYPELSEALDNMVAAGITWSTRFPYKDSWADICLSGDHFADMTADINVLGRRQWQFMTTVDLFDAGSAINEADICTETSHYLSEPVDMHLISKNRKQLLLDIANEASQVIDQLSDIIVEKLTAKSQSIDVLCMKAQHDYFMVDHISEKPKYKTLLVAMELT
jgi:hypothetical protein